MRKRSEDDFPVENCLICGKPVPDYIPQYCCDGRDCGCGGAPTEPCCCSRECERAVYDHAGKPYSVRRELSGIAPYGDGEDEDICGFCGLPGADKVPHPVRWPGEASAGTDYVHSECEQEECSRAHAALNDRQRESFLRSI